jgi:hypothetical protein
MSCFIWFNTWAVIQNAETGKANADPSFFAGYASASISQVIVTPPTPTDAFLEWTETVLRTTQLSDNAIQLALLYIYRLKKYNPSIIGKAGSERRLLTSALMLSNKCKLPKSVEVTLQANSTVLDDHVYTNKTWADVCGIYIREIYDMEVEFISNIRYDLLVTKEQWMDWRTKMENFCEYFLWRGRLQNQEPLENGRIPEKYITETSFLRLQPSDLPYSDGSIVNGDVTFLPGTPSTEVRKPTRFQAPAPTKAHRLEYVSAGSPVIRRVYDAASSPFERCSPRYHLSTSPDYYRRDITSTNPLSYLSPFPIHSNSVDSTPVLISSLDTTAHSLKPHEMYYRNIESSKENIQSGTVQNVLSSVLELELGLNWPPLTDADAIAY